jgi:RND family efflux transporter MFP subunit
MIRRTWAPAVLLLLVIIGSTVLVGCNLKQGNGAAAESVEVQVAKPVEQKFEDYEVFTGRTEATLYTTIRARVSGYLEAANFVEGRDVKKDDVLFEVDPAPYKAAYDQTDAAWKQAEAHRARLELDHNRAVDLYAKRAMSKSDYDLAVGDYTEAVAAVGSAAANRQAAKINLNFTKVLAPFDGRISRRMVDPGNLVKQDDTAMAVLVKLDPIYGYFDVDERTVLSIRKNRTGSTDIDGEIGAEVKIGLANESGFSHTGKIVIPDNRIDGTTGTRRVWAEFDNPAPHELLPGMFIRARVATGPPHHPLCVAEAALGWDQARRYVYVVVESNGDNVVVRKFVKVGPAILGPKGEKTGLVVVESNLDKNDLVVLTNLQRLHENEKVNKLTVKMPEQGGEGPRN